MEHIYFFQSRNRRDGSILEDYLDCDERTAWKYYKKPHEFYYVGRSDGAFLAQIRATNRLKKDERGVAMDFSEERKQEIRAAIAAEIEKAKLDKTPPRNWQILNIDGSMVEDRLKGKAAGLAGR